MATLAAVVDDFTASTINTTLWNDITAAAASLDTTNNQVVLAVPTTSGTTNVFGSNGPYDARSGSLYAQVGAAANGNGNVVTGMRLEADAANAVILRVGSGGVFLLVASNVGVVTSTTLPTYDPHLHRWWKLSDGGASWVAQTSPDGLTWTTLGSIAYTWSAAAVQVAFVAAANGAEASGNSAVISHVNTRAGGQFNPDWPRMEYAAGLWWGANGASSPLDLYVEIAGTANDSGGPSDSVSINRGRQYELDQVRAGDETATFLNVSGDLDPSVSGPYSGRIQPYQPWRVRAQWPPTVNMLSQGIATGGDIGGATTGTITASSALDVLSETDTTGGSVVSSTTAWAGGTVTQFSVPTGTAVGQRIAHTAQTAVRGGLTYTATIRVRDITASTTLQVKPHLGWVTAGSATPSSYVYGSTVTLTGSTTAGWTTLTVTGTAPSGTLGMDVGVTVAATAAATCSVQTDGWQQEKGSTASAWVCPGAWYPMYAGYTGDWQYKWGLSGTLGTVTVATADALALLAQQPLSDPLTEEIGSHSPSYLYTLADPAGSTTATDTTGSHPSLPIAVSKAGAGTLSFGNAITANTSTGVYTGSTGTVATLSNPSPGTNSTLAASYLSLVGAGIKGPQTTTFTRMIAFRYAAGANPATEAELWTAIDTHHGANPGSQLRTWIDSSGHVNASMTSFANGGVTLSSTTAAADGNWHLILFGQDATVSPNTAFFLSVDGAYTSTDASGGGGHAQPYFPTGIVSDAVGVFADGVLDSTNYAFKGDVSYVGEMPTALTATDCTNLYSAWRSACAGESTDARYARILRYAGYTGTTSIQTGQTTSMGAASFGGQDAVSALQAVVETENGEHYIARDGTPTFKSRAARYSARTPLYTFGERTDLGEWPYEDLQPVWDSSHLANEVTVNGPNSQTFYAQDTASITAYAPRPLSRTVNTTSATEAQDAANYLLSRYKQPLARISGLVLHPGGNSALWAVCFNLELGTRVRVMRRPPAPYPTVQVDCFVENLAWNLSTNGDATLTLQCSPADTLTYAVWAAWHTTLTSGIAAGVSSITVNASQDTTNPLAAQLAAGQQLVLGQGTANQETVTVQSVGATSAGWTTAVITLTAPTTKSHSAGDWVNEPLPTGVTDPTAYDYSAFDQAVYAY